MPCALVALSCLCTHQQGFEGMQLVQCQGALLHHNGWVVGLVQLLQFSLQLANLGLPCADFTRCLVELLLQRLDSRLVSVHLLPKKKEVSSKLVSHRLRHLTGSVAVPESVQRLPFNSLRPRERKMLIVHEYSPGRMPRSARRDNLSSFVACSLGCVADYSAQRHPLEAGQVPAEGGRIAMQLLVVPTYCANSCASRHIPSMGWGSAKSRPHYTSGAADTSDASALKVPWLRRRKGSHYYPEITESNPARLAAYTPERLCCLQPSALSAAPHHRAPGPERGPRDAGCSPRREPAEACCSPRQPGTAGLAATSEEAGPAGSVAQAEWR